MGILSLKAFEGEAVVLGQIRTVSYKEGVGLLIKVADLAEAEFILNELHSDTLLSVGLPAKAAPAPDVIKQPPLEEIQAHYAKKWAEENRLDAEAKAAKQHASAPAEVVQPAPPPADVFKASGGQPVCSDPKCEDRDWTGHAHKAPAEPKPEPEKRPAKPKAKPEAAATPGAFEPPIAAPPPGKQDWGAAVADIAAPPSADPAPQAAEPAQQPAPPAAPSTPMDASALLDSAMKCRTVREVVFVLWDAGVRNEEELLAVCTMWADPAQPKHVPVLARAKADLPKRISQAIEAARAGA